MDRRARENDDAIPAVIGSDRSIGQSDRYRITDAAKALGPAEATPVMNVRFLPNGTADPVRSTSAVSDEPSWIPPPAAASTFFRLFSSATLDGLGPVRFVVAVGGEAIAQTTSHSVFNGTPTLHWRMTRRRMIEMVKVILRRWWW